MNDIPARLVKELRDQTGAGMMDCKRALEETGGDLEAARRLLRERGIAQAAKRAGKETSEGKVVYRLHDASAAMVAVGCETEPVANNEEFLTFAQRVVDAVEKDGPQAADSLEEERTELVAKLGENVVVRGAARFQADDGEVLAVYVHPPVHKLGVLLHARGNPDLARQVAMHIAASRPAYVSRADVPDAEIDAEREILSKQPDVATEPEQVQAKIVEGRIEKWYADNVLEDQEWIHDTSRKVADVLTDSGLEIVEFRRFALAE